MKTILSLGIAIAFFALLVSPAFALGFLRVDDRSPAATIFVGNLSQTYNLSVNITTNETQLLQVNVTFILPYGLENTTSCTAQSVTTSNWICINLYNGVNSSTTLQANLTVKANVSAYPAYGSQNINYSIAAENNTANSTLRAFVAIPFSRNPRPYLITDSGNVRLRYTKWNQTDPSYRVMAPIWTFNVTSGRPQLANDTFGEVMYFDKSFFEQPAYMRLWTLNMTFKIIFDSVTNTSFLMRSPINNTLSSDQSFIPVFSRRQEILDPMSNVTRNFTIGVPDQNFFTVYLNGTEYNNTYLNNSLGLNISFSGGDQSSLLFDINATTTNITKINNTDITVLLTLVNMTACQASLPCSRSPIFVQYQQSNGLSFDQPPQFGQKLNISFLINVTNRLSNYTVDNISISFMQPMNVTMNETGGAVKQFNMTTPTNVKVQAWNSSALWEENLSLTRVNSNFSFTDSIDGPSKGASVNIFVTTFDVLIASSLATFQSWNPGTAGAGYAYVNFTAEMEFPTLDETTPPAGGGGTNAYNTTINSPVRTNLNLTAKLPGLDNTSTDIVVTVDGVQLTGGNFTIGSLVVKDVSAGQHSISVTYKVPAASTSSSTTSTSSSGGGGGSAVPPAPPKRSFSWDIVAPIVENKAVISNEQIDVTQVVYKVVRNVQSARIVVSKLNDKPVDVPVPAGTVSQYLDIAGTNLPEDVLSSAKIRFRATKAFLDSKGFKTENVVLQRYTTSGWAKLPTELIGPVSDGAAYEFEATTPGFSTFAITAEAAAAPPPSVQPAAQLPIEPTPTQEEITVTPPEIVSPPETPSAAALAIVVVLAIAAVVAYLHFHHPRTRIKA